MAKVIYETVITDKDFPFRCIFNKQTDTTNGWGLHWHESIEMIYVTEGEGKVICAGVTYIVEQGSIILLPSERVHNFVSSGTLLKYHCMLVHEDFFTLSNMDISLIKSVIVLNNDNVRRLFDIVVYEYNNTGKYYRQCIYGCLLQLFTYVMRDTHDISHTSEVTQEKQNSMVKNAISYMKNNFKYPISTADMCEFCGYNINYFCRVFKTYTGKTPIEYLTYIRLSNADKLLSSKLVSVSEAAYESGFSSTAYFTKKYKEQFKRLPSQS